MSIVSDAGLAGPRESAKSGPEPFLDAAAVRKARIAATARMLRNAQSDDDAAEALSAVLELAKE